LCHYANSFYSHFRQGQKRIFLVDFVLTLIAPLNDPWIKIALLLFIIFTLLELQPVHFPFWMPSYTFN
jgi:hypothetical protein